jgi:hypothetical protein
VRFPGVLLLMLLAATAPRPDLLPDRLADRRLIESLLRPR